MNRRYASCGFTLVELLVVIGIIALLIGILLPTLAQARSSAWAAVCASNMRQLAAGWFLYADANHGTSVPGRMANNPTPAENVYDVGNGEQWRPRGFVTLGQAAGFHAFSEPSPDPANDNLLLVDNPVFLCPEAADWTNNRNFGLGYNWQFLGNTRRKTDGTRRFINFPVRISRISGSETVLFADTLGTAGGKATDARLANRVDGSQDEFALGNHGWSLDPPRMTPNSDYCNDSTRRPDARSGPDARHRGRANFVFCDSSVRAATPQDMGYALADDGRFLVDGPDARTNETAHNRFFSGRGEDFDPPRIDE